MKREMSDVLFDAMYVLQQYCKHNTCHECILYKPEKGCFFRYHGYDNMISPCEWDIDAVFDLLIPDDD